MRILQWLYAFPLRLRSLLRRDRVDDELDEELQYHVERQVEQNIARGMAPEEARSAALRAIGRVDRHKEGCRDARRVNVFDDFLRDVRYAGRTILRNRGFAAVAVLSLAVGIGANTAVFSVIDPLLLRRLPVPDPDALVLVSTPPPGTPSYSISYPAFRHLQEQSRSFSNVTADFLLGGPRGVQARIEGSSSEAVSYQTVAGDFFSTLGVEVVAGRKLNEADAQTGAPPVVVIGHDFWMRRFNGDAAAVGKNIRFGDEPVPSTIVGIAPPGFTGFDVTFSPDLWRPLVVTPGDRLLSNPDAHVFRMMGRLQPGVSIEQARAEVEGIYRRMLLERLGSEAPVRPERREAMLARRIELQSGATGTTPLRLNMATPFKILFLAVASVLLIACINVGGLLLARTVGRRRELALRLAIGSGRFRLVRQLFTESMALAVLGGIGGLIVAYGGARWLLSYLPAPAAANLDVGFDARVLGFTMAVSVVSALLFGIVPSYRAMKRDLNPAHSEGPRTSSRSPHRMLSRALVIVQVAISMVLLVGTGLLVRTLHNFNRLDTGFDRESTVRFEVDRGRIRHSPEEWMEAFTRLVNRLEAYPGVRSASLTASLGFLRGARSSGSVEVSGRTATPDEDSASYQMYVGPGFFASSGISLVAGREIQPGDERPGPRVAVINQTMARRLFGDASPIGRYFRFNREEDIEVIGVAEDAKYDTLREAAQPTFYAPFTASFFGTAPGPGVSILASGESGLLKELIPTAVSEFDPSLRAVNLQTLGEIADNTLGQERLLVQFTSLFSALALLLACIGLYGMLSYGVAQRNHEIGVRIALGARVRNVMRLILVETGWTVGLGLALGLLGAFGATRLISSYLFGLSATDPATTALAALLLIAAAAIAAVLPAHRACRVDPLAALRHE